MNNRKRLKLNEAIALIRRANSMVQSVCDEEENGMDRLPENMEDSILHERMETAVDELDSALDELDSAIEHIESAESV